MVAGLRVAQSVFERVDPGLVFVAHCPEGKWRESGAIAEIAGAAASILAGERVALNFLGRLSGVATLTARYVRAVEGTGARILDTRKTTPGLRELEKAAVRAGGGVSHRSGLYDAILVKENHAALAGGVGEATRLALAGAPEGVTVEVECATLEEVEAALAAGVPRILLDNMAPPELRRAVELAGDGPSWRPRAGSRSTRCVRWPRRAWTTSAWARSRTRRPRSTSACCSTRRRRPQHGERVGHGELVRAEAVDGGRAPAVAAGGAPLARGLEQAAPLEHAAQVRGIDR